MDPAPIGPERAAQTRKLTYRDFVRFPDDRQRHELIDGVHYVTPSPADEHQVILGNLHYWIRAHLQRHPAGRVYLSPFDVVFSMFDVVEPDLLFISTERLAIITRRNVRGAPDLVVEIGSPSTRRRDEDEKLRLYDRFGVDEYWVVDPQEQAVRVYRRRRAALARVAELLASREEVLTTPIMPGLALPLTHVFER
jgi:Uma2 family endonuclease